MKKKKRKNVSIHKKMNFMKKLYGAKMLKVELHFNTNLYVLGSVSPISRRNSLKQTVVECELLTMPCVKPRINT